MQWMLVSLASCIIAQLVGFVAVLVSMHLLVVPRFDGFSKSWRRTRCYIKNISFSASRDISGLETLTQSNVSILAFHEHHGVTQHHDVTHTSHKAAASVAPLSSASGGVVCAWVLVEYEARDSTLQLAFLQRKGVPAYDNSSCSTNTHVRSYHEYNTQ